MAKFIKKYSTEAQYVSDATVERMKSGEFPLPNVGYVQENKGVHYNKKREFLELNLSYTGGVITEGSIIEVNEGESVTVNVSVTPSTASDKSVIWTVDDETIATVTGSGTTFTINGIAQGQTSITCRTNLDPTATITFNFNCMEMPTELQLKHIHSVIFDNVEYTFDGYVEGDPDIGTTVDGTVYDYSNYPTTKTLQTILTITSGKYTEANIEEHLKAHYYIMGEAGGTETFINGQNLDVNDIYELDNVSVEYISTVNGYDRYQVSVPLEVALAENFDGVDQYVDFYWDTTFKAGVKLALKTANLPQKTVTVKTKNGFIYYEPGNFAFSNNVTNNDTVIIKGVAYAQEQMIDGVSYTLDSNTGEADVDTWGKVYISYYSTGKFTFDYSSNDGEGLYPVLPYSVTVNNKSYTIIEQKV